MRIEKINDNQIRCTLTKSDLEEHQVMLNELAFGSDHAKDLFRDMMAQASAELGFEAEDIPLMIEAVPVSSEKLVLIITKIEDPEELDDHVSKYMHMLDLSDEEDEKESEDEEKEILSPFEPELPGSQTSKASINQFIQEVDRLANRRAAQRKKEERKNTSSKQPLPETHRIYRFPSLMQTIQACEKIYPLYEGDNTLYKDAEENFYYLVMTRGNHPQEAFKQIGNVLSEFGLQIPYSYNTHAYFDEHFVTIIEHNAVNTLLSL